MLVLSQTQGKRRLHRVQKNDEPRQIDLPFLTLLTLLTENLEKTFLEKKKRKVCFGASAFVIQEQRCLWVVGHPEVEREGEGKALPNLSHGFERTVWKTAPSLETEGAGTREPSSTSPSSTGRVLPTSLGGL